MLGWGAVPTAEPALAFDAISIDDVPAQLFGLTSWSDDASPISRREAIQVPAVKRGRDLIVGTLGVLPIDLTGPDGSPADQMYTQLLQQPENGIPRSVTLARTLDDLLFHGNAWWLVVETAWHGYPTKVVRLDPTTVSIRQDGKVWRTKAGNTGTSWEFVDDFDIIRFDSPNDALLTAGARAIRAARELDKAALTYSSGRSPIDYLTPKDGVDLSQEQTDAVMDAWDAARRQNATGWVPGAVSYNTAGWNPEQLQLADARQHASLEIARLMGVDPEDLGVSTTSRTYQNAQDRRQARIQDTLAPYAVALEQRLSMNDVTPRGYSARVNFSDFLRADDATRMSVAVAGKSAGILTDQQAAQYFDPNTDVQVTPAAADQEAQNA